MRGAWCFLGVSLLETSSMTSLTVREVHCTETQIGQSPCTDKVQSFLLHGEREPANSTRSLMGYKADSIYYVAVIEVCQTASS